MSMDRHDWMVVKMTAAALVPAALGVIAVELGTSTLYESPITAPLGRLIAYAGAAGAALTLVLLSANVIRLWRMERGLGSLCHYCGGLLGRVREGKRRRPDYRKCWCCGRNVAEHN